MIQRFDNIGIAVTDFKKAVDFYERLGFKVGYGTETTASLAAGDAVLYLFQTSSKDAPRPRRLDLDTNPPGIDHISFRVGDVDEAFNRLQQRGVAVEDPPADQSWGSRTLTLLDPDGNRIYFLGPLKEAS